jgi:hypothetical protein
MFEPIDPNLSPKLRQQLYREQRSKVLGALAARLKLNWTDMPAREERARLVVEIIKETKPAYHSVLNECLRSWRCGLQQHAVLLLTSVTQIGQDSAKFLLMHLDDVT